MEKFDVRKVALEKTNLIEASAGTGKTFSIALLAVRLITEKGMAIPNILMVTFTNAAVAELESRIRSFIRDAFTYVETGAEEDINEDLVFVLDKAVEKQGKEQVLQNLHNSMLFLDETSIFTIHSFCQRTLTEFAFETNQAFENEIASDTSPFVEEAVKKFWRERITMLETGLLIKLLEKDLSIAGMSRYVADHLGKEEVETPVTDQDLLLAAIRECDDAKDQAWQAILEYYDDHTELIISSSQSGYQKASFSKIANQREAFLEKYKEKLTDKKPPKYISSFLPDLGSLFAEYMATDEALSESVRNYLDYLYFEALLHARKEIDQVKQNHGLLFYDDLIQNLRKAVEGPNRELLTEELNEKYHAVFIDEFHDTDKNQYKIFSRLFIGRCPVFLIGDPKQSIYAWRGADIETYKMAAKEADRQYTMESNYRSTAGYIAAMNAIYAHAEEPFCDPDIQYVEVKAGRDVGKLVQDNEEVIPVGVIRDEKKEDAYVKVARVINELLTGSYSIQKTGKEQPLKPSDIAVLVRSNFESPGIKRELARLGIPAVTSDDTRVLLSDEAKGIFYILNAILEPRIANVNRALATAFTGLSTEELLELDERLEVERFREFFETLDQQGIYGALMAFASTYRVKQKCLENNNGERIISNFLQTAELLQKRQIEKGQTAEQLLTWLQRVLEGEITSGEEYEQRVESDENAVTITTIHRSKGLAYNIVFAPFLNMKSHEEEDEEGRDDDCENNKEEQENRRLMYVALTRAVFKCFINITSSNKGFGSIHRFEDSIMAIDESLVETVEVPEEPLPVYETEEVVSSKPPRIFRGKIDRSWRILSFSGLSEMHEPQLIEETTMKGSDYDAFIFERFPKGVVAGLFIHEVFEHINFKNPAGWDEVILKSTSKYGIAVGEDLPYFRQVIGQVLNADYSSETDHFKLSSLPDAHRINELEFYFALDRFRTDELNRLVKNIGLAPRNYEGAMHGFVDLFFEMNGRYYILDWKSNYLGDSVEQYTGDRLELAMTANNYHLQYLIYTVAVKRFLENRVKGFDYDTHFGGVFYVFLRGCREGAINGLYYTRPGKDVVDAADKIFAKK
jgi:exodeoxyribonuclease V beta subunit